MRSVAVRAFMCYLMLQLVQSEVHSTRTFHAGSDVVLRTHQRQQAALSGGVSLDHIRGNARATHRGIYLQHIRGNTRPAYQDFVNSGDSSSESSSDDSSDDEDSD